MQNTFLTDKFIKKAYPTKLYPLKANIVGPHHTRSRDTIFGISCLCKRNAQVSDDSTILDAENKTKPK